MMLLQRLGNTSLHQNVNQNGAASGEGLWNDTVIYSRNMRNPVETPEKSLKNIQWERFKLKRFGQPTLFYFCFCAF